jgi:site-specific recombinase XerC
MHDRLVPSVPARVSGFRGASCGTRPILADLSTVVARRWLLAEQSGRTRPLSPNSLAGRVRTVKAFGGWVFREVGLPVHPLSGLLTPRVPDVLVPSLRDPEMRALLAAAASSKDPLRDQAVVSLLLDAGIRLRACVRMFERETRSPVPD